MSDFSDGTLSGPESNAMALNEIIAKAGPGAKELTSIIGLLFYEPLRVEIVGSASNFDLLIAVSAMLRTVLQGTCAEHQDHPKTMILRAVVQTLETLLEVGEPENHATLGIGHYGHA